MNESTSGLGAALAAFRDRPIGVLMGGPSAEREVSLNTGRGVHAALVARGWNAVALDWTADADVSALLGQAKVAMVWNALHGTFGEDGAIQGLLDCIGLPYTGSGVLASALAMDKVRSKQLFERAGIATAPWRVLGEADGSEAVIAAAAVWGWPLVVKPGNEGSSVGVSIVHGPDEAAAAVALARRHHGPVLVEKFVPGQEIDVGVLTGQVVGHVEIRPAKEFYDYEAKYLRSDTQYLVPAPVGPAVDAELRRAAIAAFEALGCRGHARVDFRVDPSGGVFILEVNTLPGMTKTSLLPKLAAHAGMSYGELCEAIMAASLR
jgi:D-alanine-D-alanine ligase